MKIISLLISVSLLTACSGGGVSAQSENSFVSGTGTSVFIEINDRKDAPIISGELLLGGSKTLATDQVKVINVWASWCAPCQAMKKMFKEKEVKEKLDKFVVLIVDVDENPTLKKKYKVKSIPDYRILNSDLEVEKKFVGGQTKYKFAKWLDD